MTPRLITLGSARLETDAPSMPPGVAQGKPLGILIYLAFHEGKWVSRDTLLDLFWSSTPPESARHALRQALYVIRKVLPEEALLTDGAKITLQGGVILDVKEVHQALAEGDPQRALALYQGDFLDGFALEGASEFGHWADGKRATLRALFRATILEEVARERGAGNWNRALGMVERALEGERPDMEMWLLKVELLLRSGRRAEARAAAEGMRRECQECFGEKLPGELEDWLRRVEAGEGGGAPAPGEELREEARTPGLGGREAELAALRRFRDRAAEGEGGVLLVTGEAGAGKTRLLEEATRPEELEGAAFIRARGYEPERELTYGLMAEVVRQAMTAPGFAGVGTVWLEELAPVLPELVERYPKLAAPDGNPGAGARRCFCEAVAQVFDALAHEAPVVCLLDDLHWADEGSLELFHYLARRLCASPVLLLGAFRPSQASDPLNRLRRSLVKTGVAQELALERWKGERDPNGVSAADGPESRRGRGIPLRSALTAALLAVTALGLWLGLAPRGGERELPPLLPLPEGVLIWLTAQEWEGYAVVDPSRPGAPPLRLSPEQLRNLGEEGFSPSVLLSPDRSLLATVRRGEGGAPLLLVHRRDGGELQPRLPPGMEGLPLSWLPDGSGILVRTVGDAEGTHEPYGITLVPLDGSGPRPLLRFSAPVISAAVSRSGTRIAFTRVAAAGEVWVANFDGSDPRMVLEGRPPVGRIWWGPGDSLLVYEEVGGGGSVLRAVHPRRLESWDLTSPELNAEGVAWGGDAALFYLTGAADGSRELFAARPDGSELARLTYSRAQKRVLALLGGAPSSFVRGVEILAGADGGVRVPVGGEVRAAAAVVCSGGQVLHGYPVRWRCLDPDVCTATGEGVVRGLGPGHTFLVADLGGWRADTVPVEVAAGRRPPTEGEVLR